MRKNMKKLLLVSSVCALSLGCSSSVYAGRVYNAAEAGDLVALRRFVYTENESVNDRNRYDDNNTALMVAAYKGHFKVVEFLVDNGADVNARDKRGRTPLTLALENGYTDVVKYLKKHGAV